jgi:hypothetical protein
MVHHIILKIPPKQSYTNITILPSLMKWDAGTYCKCTYSVIWCMQSQVFRINQSSFSPLLLLWICIPKAISVNTDWCLQLRYSEGGSSIVSWDNK